MNLKTEKTRKERERTEIERNHTHPFKTLNYENLNNLIQKEMLKVFKIEKEYIYIYTKINKHTPTTYTCINFDFHIHFNPFEINSSFRYYKAKRRK